MQVSRKIQGPREPSSQGGSKGPWVLIALAAIGLFLAARRLWPETKPAATPAVAESARAVAARPTTAPSAHGPEAMSASATAEPALGPMAASLRGTDEDGALRVDERGELIVDRGVAAFFEYYLSATGEESPATIKARILKRIHDKLKPPASDRAAALLDKYLAYREATRGMKAGAEGDIAARLEALHRLRKDTFGSADADKLFGVEERATAVAIEQQKIQKDPALSPEDRKRKLDALEAQLPDDVRKAREAALGPLRQQEEEQALRAAGATDEEIQRHRVETVGQEGAERLKSLDQQRADWKKRLAAFQAARAAIVQSQPPSVSRDAAVEKLLNDSFTPEERLRVKAADAIAAEGKQ